MEECIWELDVPGHVEAEGVPESIRAGTSGPRLGRKDRKAGGGQIELDKIHPGSRGFCSLGLRRLSMHMKTCRRDVDRRNWAGDCSLQFHYGAAPFTTVTG